MEEAKTIEIEYIEHESHLSFYNMSTLLVANEHAAIFTQFKLHVNGDRHAKAMYVKSSKTSQLSKTKKCLLTCYVVNEQSWA